MSVILGDSIAVDEALLVLKALFLVLLYLFIWRIVRSASKDVRLPQESFILRPGERGRRRAGAAAAVADRPADRASRAPRSPKGRRSSSTPPR